MKILFVSLFFVLFIYTLQFKVVELDNMDDGTVNSIT